MPEKSWEDEYDYDEEHEEESPNDDEKNLCVLLDTEACEHCNGEKSGGRTCPLN